MNILDLIKSRRTIQAFTEDKVSREIIDTTIQLAIQAPNHKLTQPWFFIYAGPKTRSRLGQLSIELKNKKSPLTDVQRVAMKKKFESEGELILVFMKKSNDPITYKEDYAAVACAIQNMSLYLHSAGYGSKWGTGEIIRHEETYKTLNISSQEHELCGLFWFGIPKVTPAIVNRQFDAKVFRYFE